jgi:hypothetical protein
VVGLRLKSVSTTIFGHICSSSFATEGSIEDCESATRRIDDLQATLKPRWTMSKILTDAPDAFPDEKQDKPQKN